MKIEIIVNDKFSQIELESLVWGFMNNKLGVDDVNIKTILSCPVCGSTNVVLKRDDIFYFYKCKNCNLRGSTAKTPELASTMWHRLVSVNDRYVANMVVTDGKEK